MMSPASQSDSFADSIGFATHISYTDQNYYTQFSTFASLLVASGARHIRDGLNSNWTSTTDFVANYHTLGQSGIDLIAISDGASTAASIQQFAGWVGNLAGLEGMNECDQNNCIPAAIAQLPILQVAGAALGIPVIGLSFTSNNGYAASGNIKPYINYNNIHCYYGGRNPDANGGGWGGINNPSIWGGAGYAVTNWWQYQNQANAINTPNIVTESGYYAPPSPTPYQVTEAIQSRYLPRLLLENFMYGIKRTYLYEFLDESGAYWGVVRPDMSIKPAYTAIQNLIALTSDKGSAFVPKQLRYTITGGDSTLHQVLLQKRSGQFILAVWLEQSGYEPSTNTLTPVAPQTVTLSVPGHTLVASNQFSDAGTYTTTSLSGSSASLTVTDSINLIQIN